MESTYRRILCILYSWNRLFNLFCLSVKETGKLPVSFFFFSLKNERGSSPFSDLICKCIQNNQKKIGYSKRFHYNYLIERIYGLEGVEKGG